MKNKSGKVVTTLYSYILDAQVHLTVVGGQVWREIKLIQAFMDVTCKNEEDPFKNEGATVPIVSLCRFFMTLKGC